MKIDVYNSVAVDKALSKYRDYLTAFGHTAEQIDKIILTPIIGHRKPTKAEIKFGEGAAHYKDFDRFLWIKSDGKVKKWIVCPHDGLRYYR